MLNSYLHFKESHHPESTQPDHKTDQPFQHGISYSNHSLLGVPSETLTGITSYLDPPSLLSLSRVNSTLYRHVGHDNTWRRAFASRYLGIGPENDLGGNISYSILFRRSERTWKNEYTSRFKLERKWENSRSASISHAPVPSAISRIHLMSCQVVLSSCLKYGIVARSLPLNGKVFSGYLSAAANGVGIGGIGNPNMEFAPNASTCTVASRGGSASLLWGFLDGSVSVVFADKVMNPRRVTTQLQRCSVHEDHQGPVSDSAWYDDEAGSMRAVTGGIDGQIKLWNAEPFECVWASDRQLQGLVADPCVKVAIEKGTVAAAFHSGNIYLWTGTPLGQQFDLDFTGNVRKIHIPCPLLQESLQDDNNTVTPSVTYLLIDRSNDGIALLVAYNSHSFFYRIKVALGITPNDFSPETTAFGDPSFGPISCVSPYFAPQPDVGSFVIAGDSLGCISIYDWRSTAPHQKPIRKFEAYEDGATVTAIAWNGVTMMTGSSRGSIHVWDGLTFKHLRSFAHRPSRRHRPHFPGDEVANDETVKQIIIDASQEMFVACAGDRVLAWKAGLLQFVSSRKHRVRSGASHATKENRTTYAKYLEQLELKETVEESRQMVEQETETFKRAVNREKEHRTRLEKLGLTEAEAVEYVMMLSLEEAAARGGSPNESETAIEDVFDIDDAFEEGRTSFSCRSSSPASISTASDHTWSSSALSYVGSPSSFHATSRYEEVVQARNAVSVAPGIRTSLSTSSVSSVSSSSLSAASSVGARSFTAQSDLALNEAHFPPIAGTGGASAGTGLARDIGTSAVTSGKGNASRSPNNNKTKKSWSNVAGSSSPHPSLVSATTGRSSGTRRFQPVGAGSGIRYTSSSFHATSDTEMDEDLRYALELSFAEAQSNR